MKETVFLIFMFVVSIMGQAPVLYPPTFWITSATIIETGFGQTVDTVDMNRDHKVDVLVGGWNRTYTYFGGYGILDTQIDMEYRGRLLAVCDYNGDGYNDLITMHFTRYDSARADYDGEILFYYGSNSGSVLIDTIPEYSIPLPTKYPKRNFFSIGLHLDIGVTHGDFNGDGKQDIVISSADSSATYLRSKGVVYIFMGKDSQPLPSPDFVVAGRNAYAFYGMSVGVGDINGDAIDDLLISSRITKSNGHSDSLTALHIYYGKSNFTFYENGEDKLFKTICKRYWAEQGWFWYVFSVIDVNGDGIKDFLSSIQRERDLDKKSLNIHYGGKPEGLDTIPDYILTDIDTAREYSFIGDLAYDIGDYNMDGYNDFALKPADYLVFSIHLGGPYINNKNPYAERGFYADNDEFPNAVIGVGDQSGDGVNDILCLSMPGNGPFSDRGTVMMIYGYSGMHTAVEEKQPEYSEKTFRLWNNYPNPFNPETVISYQLPKTGKVKLELFTILGEKITTLIDENKEAGTYDYHLSASKYKLTSGIYIVRMLSDDYSKSIKMNLIK